MAAQQGIDAQIYWPGVGQVRATELVLRRLLPLAHQGLEAWGAPPTQIDRLLGHHRAALPDRHQRRRVVRRPDGAARRPGDRYDALRATLVEYRERHAHQRAGAHLGLSGLTGSPRRASRSRFHAPPAPVRGSTQPSRVTTTNGQRDARPRRRPRGRPRASRRRRPAVQVARPGQPDQAVVRPSPAARRRSSRAATTSVRRAWSSASSRVRRSGRCAPAGVARRAASGRAAPPALAARMVEHRAAQRAGQARVDGSVQRRHPRHRVGPAAARARDRPQVPLPSADWIRCPRSHGDSPGSGARRTSMGTDRGGLRAQAGGRGRAATRAIEEAKLRGSKLVVVNSHRGGDDFDGAASRQADQAIERGARRSSTTPASSYEVRQLVRGFEPAEDLIGIAETSRRRADRDRAAPPLAGRQADPRQQRPADPARRPVPGAGGQGRVEPQPAGDDR